ncbi:hypothetical protein CHU98_g11417 [Xylaria longipes]|nr:hypothetical protein CHU98_g11417 [Xylaria longipes]
MTSQTRLVEEIESCFDQMEAKRNELREYWGVMEVSQIQEVAEAMDATITFTKTGLSNPTDMDEYNKIERWIDRLENYYIEARGFLHEAKACADKITQQEREDSDEDSDEDRLSVILELSDEGST